MFKNITIVTVLLISSMAFSQKKKVSKTLTDTYTFDASYGLTAFNDNQWTDKLTVNASHLDFGVRWIEDNSWGMKISVGFDKTRVTHPVTGLESGCDYTRYTASLIYNAKKLFNSDNSKFNFYTHAGLGYASQNSTILTSETDELVNFVYGINPQYQIADDLSLGVDFSGVSSLFQNYYPNGTQNKTGSGLGEAAFFYNLSLTVSYTFSK